MDPVDNIVYYKFGIFYYNPSDYRTLVPKTTRALGWTVNFARPGSYVFLFTVLVAVVIAYNT